MPDVNDFAQQSPRGPRHRADPTPLGYGNRARALLDLLRGHERPRLIERPAPMPRVPGMRDLQPADPHTIGEYQVLGRLGSGSQGVVYLATTRSGDRVAIKRLNCEMGNEQAHQQFAKEVAAARRVAPFCTAQLIDADLKSPTPYLVSEYIEGPSLRQKISQDGPMTATTLQRLAVGTATALAAIHQAGIVHRDFQPANVMLSPEGPRVVDFGIARDLSLEATTTSAIIGTPAYMSPEQFRDRPVGPATDMFAWASVIAYAATGRAPFQADHPIALAYRIAVGIPTLTGVPAALLPVLKHCLEKDPDRRPTAQQVLAMLLGRPEFHLDQRFPAHQLIRSNNTGDTGWHRSIHEHRPAGVTRRLSSAGTPARRTPPRGGSGSTEPTSGSWAQRHVQLWPGSPDRAEKPGPGCWFEGRVPRGDHVVDLRGRDQARVDRQALACTRGRS